MQLATVSNKITTYAWPSGQYIGYYQPEFETQDQFKSCSWANNNEWICTVTPHGMVNIVSIEKEHIRHLCQIEALPGANSASFFNSTKRDIAIAYDDKILVYDLKHQTITKQYGPALNKSEFERVKIDASDTHICGSTKDNHVYIFNQNNSYSSVFNVCNIGRLTNFALSNKSSLKVAAGTNTGTCVLWELEGTTNIFNQATQSAILDIAFDYGNSFLFVTDKCKCFFQDEHNAATISCLNLDFTPVCLDFCSDGIGFGIAAKNGTVHAFDVRNMKESFLSIPPPSDGSQISQIVFDKRGHCNCIHQYDSLWKLCSPEEVSGDLHPDLSSGESTSKTITETVLYKMFGFDSELLKTETHSVINFSEQSSEQSASSLSSEIRSFIRSELHAQMQILQVELKKVMYRIVSDTISKNFFDINSSMKQEFMKAEDILSKTSMQSSTDDNSCNSF